jgi:preprotein translocase subunit SecY
MSFCSFPRVWIRSFHALSLAANLAAISCLSVKESFFRGANIAYNPSKYLWNPAALSLHNCLTTFRQALPLAVALVIFSFFWISKTCMPAPTLVASATDPDGAVYVPQ